MPQVINLPEGNTASFPDDMPKEQIEKTLQDHYKQEHVMDDVYKKPEEPIMSKVGGAAISAAESFIPAVVDSVKGIGSLAHTIANKVLDRSSKLGYSSIFNDPKAQENFRQGMDLVANKGSTLLDSIKDYASPKTDDELNALSKHPVAAGVAGAIGTVGPQVIMGNQLAKGAGAIAEPVTSQVPMLAKSPMLAGAANQAIQGGTVGALTDPENPVRGAVVGGAVGAGVGAIAGTTGDKLTKASNIINKEYTNAKAAGISPGSDVTLNNIQSQLRKDGINLHRDEIKSSIKQQVDNELERIRPNGYLPDNDRPINYVSKAAATNFPAEIERSKQLYAPIDASKQVFNPETFTTSLKQAKISDKIDLPPNISKESTINDMLAYRKQFDATIKQAKSLARNGTIKDTQANILYSLRQDLNTDIHNAAAKAGLETQLNTAEDHYNNMIRPFQVYSKNLSDLKTMTPDQVQNKVWNTLSVELKKPLPNLKKIKQISQSLGPEGQSMVGWAKIENDFQNSLINGDFSVKKFSSKIAQGENSGLNKLIMSPEHQEVIRGLNTLMVNTKQLMPTVGKEGIVGELWGNAIKKFLHNRLGIQALRMIGTSNPTLQSSKLMIRDILSGIVEGSIVNDQKEKQ